MQLDRDGYSVEEKCEQRDLPFWYIGNALTQIPIAFEIHKPEQRVIDDIVEEYKRCGVRELEL